jgi:hypothetical protein
VFETSTEIVGTLLESAVAELDIPPALREAATREYGRVGEWLSRNADGANGWAVYPQGSFLLNTVVLPASADEYDVDTVCRREIPKESTTQAKLKREVGGVLAAYRSAHQHLFDGPSRLKEGKRCWTLRYPSALRFHLDVLPAIPNPDSPPDGILITDREFREWQRSDPRAFARWFKRQAETEFIAKRMVLAEAERVPPAAIPEWEVKTTLHRVVQVLKAHRNHHFRNDLDSRPASILITTLAAHAYRGEEDLYDAVLNAAREMPQFVQRTDNGLWVPNPVEPRENFADRWRYRPSLATRCFEWLERLDEDLRAAESRRGMEKVAATLSEGFGTTAVEKAMSRLGVTYRETREQGRLRFSPSSGLLATSGAVTVRNHGFHGDSAS